MREIKFRAWRPYCRVMEYSGLSQLWHRRANNLADFFKQMQTETVQFELMQYTGLKDKNGKEIYEGDILKDSHGISTVITFHSDFHGDHFSQEYKNNPETNPNANGTWGLGFYSPPHYIEVIGNIYENPELLEGKCTQ